MTDRWQYLLLLVACLVITVPLEVFKPGVYRRPRQVVRAVLPVAAVFLIWDELAIAAQVWTYNRAYIVGRYLPVRVPIEEVLFFLVIPICGLLTYNAVTAIIDRVDRR